MNGRSKYPRQRLKFAATINDEALTEDVDPDFEIQYIDIGNVDSSGTVHEIATYRFEAAPSRARRIVRDGDVIISTVRTYLQAIAPIASPPQNLIVSTGFAVIRPRPGALDAKFCRYVLREPAFLAEVEMRSTGISYPAINASEVGDIRIPYPPLPDQRMIADFIEAESEHIDALIAAKQRLLDLLAEKRRAIVAEAVMRGLNPATPLRPSGIDWLGDIPAHWELMKLKHVGRLVSGDAITADEITKEGPYPVFGGNGLRGFTIDYNRDGHHVLIGRQGALCGNINYASGKFWASEHAIVVQESTANVTWLGELLRHMNLNQYSQSAAQPGLSAEFISNLIVPVPNSAEQNLIAQHIATETAKIDRLRDATEHSITLLKERRGALIAAAVTGQIDIPEAP